MATPNLLTGIDMRKTEARIYGAAIDGSRRFLADALTADVNARDIRIGGSAVAIALRPPRGDWWWDTTEPNASITLERWATDGSTLVRVSKSRNDRTTLANVALLAQQVRGSGDRKSANRVAQMAELVGPVAMLTVDLFDAPAQITDDILTEMRLAAASSKVGAYGFRESLSVTNISSKHVSEDDVALGIKLGGLDGQVLVDGEIKRLHGEAEILTTSAEVIKSGTRIRPTVPQHLVSA